MSKEVLQITLTKAKVPKSKIGKWLYWSVYFTVWKIWRPKILAKIYWWLSELFLRMISKSEREKLIKETEDFDVVIKNECDE